MYRSFIVMLLLLGGTPAEAQPLNPGPLFTPAAVPRSDERWESALRREGIHPDARERVRAFRLDRAQLPRLLNAPRTLGQLQVEIPDLDPETDPAKPPLILTVDPFGRCDEWIELAGRTDMLLFRGEDPSDPRIWYRLAIGPDRMDPTKGEVDLVRISPRGLEFLATAGFDEMYLHYSDVDLEPEPGGGYACMRTDTGDARQVTPMGMQGGERSAAASIVTIKLALALSRSYVDQSFNGDLPLALRQIVKTVYLTSALYEREVGIELCPVVPATLIPRSPTEGEYSLNPQDAFQELETRLDGVLHGNYDVGHLMTGYVGNIANMGGACVAGKKTQGVTSWARSSDRHNARMFGHELAHQFNAGHTFNGSMDFRHDPTAVEPDSGTSLLSYADRREIFFHAASLDQMRTHIADFCSQPRTTISASAPTLTTATQFVVPQEQPFTLTATGTLAGSTDFLQFRWDEVDVGQHPGAPPPLFFSHAWPQAGERDFPLVAELFDETGNVKPPATMAGNEMNFRVTLWDRYRGFAFQTLRVEVSNDKPLTVSPIACNPGTRRCRLSWDPGDTARTTPKVRVVLLTKDAAGPNWTHQLLHAEVPVGDKEVWVDLPGTLGSGRRATIKLEGLRQNGERGLIFAVSPAFYLVSPY